MEKPPSSFCHLFDIIFPQMAIPENSYNNPESGNVSDIFRYDDMHVCSK